MTSTTDVPLRTLGRSGLRVPLVGLGTNNFGRRIGLEQARAVVDRALDRGVHFIDTAAYYGNEHGESERILGEILAGRRERVVLATKFGSYRDAAGYDGSRRNIRKEVEESLRRLRTDYIDLYQLHFPDPLTPIDETLRALDELVRAGKLRYIGSSNFTAWQVVEAEWTARSLGLNRFVSAQNEYSALVRGAERELLPALNQYGVGLIPYYPLAYGLLSGKYQRGQPWPADSRLANWPHFAERALTGSSWDVLEGLAAFAQTRGHTLLELGWAWLAAQPGVAVVIAGATRPEQVEQNAAAVGWTLDAQELAAVGRILAGTAGVPG